MSLPDRDRIAAWLRVLLVVTAPAALLLMVTPSATLLSGATVLVVLTAAATAVAAVRVVVLPATAPPRARGPQTATFAPICRCLALPQDPVRPRAPGLV